MTLEEAFSAKKPNMENLRIFGCPVYSHIPKDKRNKLEPSGRRGYSWDTVIHPKLIEYIFHNNTRLKSAEM